MSEREHSYSLTFCTPVSIFSGLGIAGLVDRTVVRNSNNLPYIPGSTVKGRLRFFAERLLRTVTPPTEYWIHAQNQPVCKIIDTACTLCRLFGSPAVPALLSVGQASLVSPWDDLFRKLLETNKNPVVHSDVEIRPGIALSRFTRTTLQDHLFFDEAVPTIPFAGKLFLGQRVTEQETRFLIAVGKLVDALGARKAAGRGALKEGICIAEATV